MTEYYFPDKEDMRALGALRAKEDQILAATNTLPSAYRIPDGLWFGVQLLMGREVVRGKLGLVYDVTMPEYL